METTAHQIHRKFQLVPINTVRICPPFSCKRYSVSYKRYSVSCKRYSVSSFIHIRYRRNEYGTAFFRNGTGTNFCLLPYVPSVSTVPRPSMIYILLWRYSHTRCTCTDSGTSLLRTIRDLHLCPYYGRLPNSEIISYTTILHQDIEWCPE